MAIYGADFYLAAKYGRTTGVDFDVSPFTANAIGYTNVLVTWTSPVGDWTRLRLLKSRFGPAANSTDGTVVLETTGTENAYSDRDVVGGRWYYYTLFLESDGKWLRVGVTSVLPIRDSGLTETFWDRIPRYFRFIRPVGASLTDDYSVSSAEVVDQSSVEAVNTDLLKFVRVLGFGLEQIREHRDQILRFDDPVNTHVNNLIELGAQLGVDASAYEVPARFVRGQVANASLLARRRGTTDALRDVAELGTGWRIDLDLGGNRLLNSDQAAFRNPRYDEWDPSTNYTANQRVQFQGVIFNSKIATVGADQSPPDPEVATENTYWIKVSENTAGSLLADAATGAVSTWKAWVGNTSIPAALAVGISSPVDSQTQSSNALKITNTTGTQSTIDVWGAANVVGSTSPTPDRIRALGQSAPLPQPTTWDETRTFEVNAHVIDEGLLWRATQRNTANKPSFSPNVWDRAGIDERPKVAVSFWAKAKETTGESVTYPGVEFFDEGGNRIGGAVTETADAKVLYDPFRVVTALHGRTPEVALAGTTWQVLEGSWRIEEQQAYAIGYGTSGLAVAVQTVPAGLTKYNVAAEFGSTQVLGKKEGIALRYADKNNWTQVNRNGIVSKISGTLSTIHTFTTPIPDGERVTVTVNDSTRAYSVIVDGVTLFSGTLPIANSPFKHGLMVV